MVRTARDAFLLGGGLIVAAAIAALAIPRATYPETPEGTDEPTVIQVTTRKYDLARPADVKLSWTSPFAGRNAGAAGTVTALHVEAGDALECGAPVVQVNGADLVAMCASGPLWRTITPGMSGTDVDSVVAMLGQLGYLDVDTPDETQMRTALIEFQQSRGEVPDGTISPDDVVWIPATVTPSTLDLSLGDQLQGTETLFTVAPELQRAGLAEPITGNGQSWVFSLEGSSARYEVDLAMSQITDADFGLELLGLFQGQPLPATVNGSVRLAEPIDVIGVPASSILSGAVGQCVLLADSTEATPVTVLGASVGTAFVEAEIPSGAFVVADPPRDDADTC